MAQNGDFSSNNNNNNNGGKRGRYNIPRRERDIAEIHRLIVEEGLSNSALCQRLNLPKRTLDRYLHEIFQEDTMVLLRPTAEQVALQTSIFKEQLMEQRKQLLVMANDSSVDPEARIKAHELAENMAWGCLKLLVVPPAALERGLRRLEGMDPNVSALVGMTTAQPSQLINNNNNNHNDNDDDNNNSRDGWH